MRIQCLCGKILDSEVEYRLHRELQRVNMVIPSRLTGMTEEKAREYNSQAFLENEKHRTGHPVKLIAHSSNAETVRHIVTGAMTRRRESTNK